ncbi:MAG: hypothetical protein CL583_06565 [Alteromonadaceae bacterium]|nr:hypothetical protein [Alteromonadaceae bacterium]
MAVRDALAFWRRIPLRSQVFAGLALPIVVVAAMSWIVERSLQSAEELSADAEQNIRGIVVRGEALNAILDAETGERGYVITGDRNFLEPYTSAQADFMVSAKEWRALNGNGSGEALDRVAALYQRWRDNVAEPVIYARAQSPGRLFNLSFEALYHVRALQAQLDTGLPLEDIATQRLPDGQFEFEEPLRRAVRLSRGTVREDNWLQASLYGARLESALTPQPGPDTDTDSQEAQEAQEAQELATQLADLLKELTRAAQEADELAVEIVASGSGSRLMDEIRTEVEQSIAAKEQEQLELAQEAREEMRFVKLLSTVLPVAGVGIGLALLLIMQLDTIRSIGRLRSATKRIEQGDLDARVEDPRSDELGALGQGFNRMAERVQGLERETRLLDSLQAMLISSNSEAEAYESTARAIEKLLPRLSGALYVLAASRDFAERTVSWGVGQAPVSRFHPEDCRALRIGRTHRVSPESAELFCPHVESAQLALSICIPLTTRDEVLGTLFLSAEHLPEGKIDPHELTLAKTVAERLALSLSNLRLAEKLRRQSVRDPLTGLFNRRYLEETFDRELARMERSGKHLAAVAVDVDHFKRFNDTFGHEAGDLVLKELAAQMVGVVRSGDIACRFGGEEFILVLPEAGREVAQARAEELRTRIEQLELHYGGKSLGSLTVSLGIAVYPEHAQTKEALLRMADNALYTAKHEGRNCVIISAGPSFGNA